MRRRKAGIPCAAVLALSAFIGPAHAQDGEAPAFGETSIADQIAPPPDAQPLIAEFFEICSAALDDPRAARMTAQRHGWSMPDGASPPALPPRLGSFMSLQGDGARADLEILNLIENRYPDGLFRSCSIQLMRPYDLSLNIPLLGEAPGFNGAFGGVPTMGGFGRWSRVIAGDVVMFDVIHQDEEFLSITLGRFARAPGE